MPEAPTKRDRIDGWKSIADYLNRDVTTVIRWAKFHGLPVNRVPAGKPRRAVFALKSEIDAWVASDAPSIAAVAPDVSASPGTPQAAASDSSMPVGQGVLPDADTPDTADSTGRKKALRWRKPVLGAAGVLVPLLIWGVLRFTDGLRSIPASGRTAAPETAQKLIGEGPIILRGAFECVGCGSNNGYLASGIADQLAADLVRIPGVHVRASDAARTGSPQSISLLLTGSVAPKDNTSLEVSVVLANGNTREQVWIRHYAVPAAGLPQLEFDIANDIFRYLRPYLPPRDTTPFKALWTRDPGAYDLYLRGREQLLFPGPKATPAAIHDFSEAVRRDPLFAAAYGELARAYYVATFDAGISSREAMPLVKANARKQIELDELAPEGHAYLAEEELTFEYKWKSAELDFQRAISLNPDNPLPHRLYVQLLLGERRLDEALGEAQISKSLEPGGLRGDFYVAITQANKWDATRNLDDLAAAESTCRSAIQRHPDYVYVRYVLVELLWSSHRFEAAAEENLSLAEVMQDATAISFMRSAKSIVAAAGPAQYALAMAHYCEPRARADWTCSLALTAQWYVQGGDTENAIRLLNKLVDNRDNDAIDIAFDAVFDPLRAEPRFKRLVAEIHPGSD